MLQKKIKKHATPKWRIGRLPIFLLFTSFLFVFSCSKDSNILDQADLDQGIELRHDVIPGYDFNLTPCESPRITYYINPNCDGTDYENPIELAIQEFNNAPIRVGFIPAYSAADADIVINCFDGFNSACGEGATQFPFATPSVQKAQILLYTNWESCPCTDGSCNDIGYAPACMLTRTVMHELMHALGLHHNGSGDWIPGTPDTDYEGGSIINSGPLTHANCDWCTAPCHFSPGDLAALNILYPQPEILDCYDCYCYCKKYSPFFGRVITIKSPISCDQADACWDAGGCKVLKSYY